MVVDASAAPQVIEHVNLALGLTPYDARWLPCSARIVLIGQRPSGTGLLRLYRFVDGQLQVGTELDHGFGLKCSTFGASNSDARQLATGDFHGGVSIWDMETLAPGARPAWAVPSAHMGLVNCIDGVGGLDRGYGAPELATGGRDGVVRVWDPRQHDPVAAICPVREGAGRDCWTVAFGGAYDDAERCIAAGYDNGDVKLLDLRTNKIRWETNVKV